MILAEIRVTFRSPAFFGEVLTVESRLGRIGRTSFTLEHRITASASARGEARLVATAEAVQVLYDYATSRPRPVPRRGRRPPRGLRGPPAPRLSSGASASGGYASKRRKIATAFWPPNPKPLTATVSTFASRATSGT